MKKTVFIIWKTDKNQRKASREFVAVCSSFRVAVSNVLAELQNAGFITIRDLGKLRIFLNEQKQTQGFDVNYIIEEIELNKIY